MEIEIKKFEKPIIIFNKQEIENELKRVLEDYKGIVVTDETLKGAKSAQKELAGLRIKIDEYRKEKKQEAEEPIKAFEKECKELIALVEETEKPIKDGISYFDNQRKQEKIKIAQEIIEKEIANVGLDEKYASRLTIESKYTNLTSKENDVREDVSHRAFYLKLEQDKEEERNKIIQSTIDYENRTLTSKLSMDDNIIRHVIVDGVETNEIVSAIREIADAIRKNDIPAEQNQKPNAEGEKYYAEYKIVGTIEQLRSVSDYLDNNDIKFEIKGQGKWNL